ncbi:DUF423 domain-containing protein [Thalassospiraceae bacterium LMO-JJ14]|nr:DUF423 domain-containing protein [Thalassospiraceae bacterium LMO-JJ14]
MTESALSRNYLLAAAALSAAAAVGLGAYGAHGLGTDQSLVGIWKTGVAYQMWHALGVFACAWVATRRTGLTATLARISGWMLLVGSLAFAASLYIFVLNGIVPITGLAPTGGMIMIAGWILIGISALRRA